MKKAPTYLAAIAALLFAGIQAQAQTNLANLGSNNFGVILSDNANVTQTATSLTFSPTALGGLFGGIYTNSFTSNAISYNWSAYSDTNVWSFGLFMSVPAAGTNAPFTVEFYNSLFDLVARYQGASPSDATPSFVAMSSVPGIGSGNFTDIGGFQMSWDTSETGSVVVESVGVVPEPSTWALLVFGSATVVFVAFRRRSLAKARQ